MSGGCESRDFAVLDVAERGAKGVGHVLGNRNSIQDFNRKTAMISGRTVSNRRAAPGRKGHWLLGSLADYRHDRLRFLEDLRREFGTVVAYRLGSMRFLLVSEPDLIQEVLVARNKE